MITLNDVCVFTETELKYDVTDDGKTVCNFNEFCEIINDGVLIAVCGSGKTKKSADKDLLSQIRGKRIVFNAYSSNRREYNIPDILKKEKENG